MMHTPDVVTSSGCVECTNCGHPIEIHNRDCCCDCSCDQPFTQKDIRRIRGENNLPKDPNSAAAQKWGRQ